MKTLKNYDLLGNCPTVQQISLIFQQEYMCTLSKNVSRNINFSENLLNLCQFIEN